MSDTSGSRAPRLVRTQETVTLTFAVYELEVPESDIEDARSDPEGFVRNAIEIDTGAPINQLFVDLKAVTDGLDGARPVPQVYHCEAPPKYESKWITIVL